MRRRCRAAIRFGLRLVLFSAAAGALSSCADLGLGGFRSKETETTRHLVILYTNDEHGWMEPYQNTSGAAGMARLWKQREGLGEDHHLLVLSGGDMWTGPALSTVHEGQSMAEVMNHMGYRAAAIGNHDFDFGQQALRARLTQSDFPFLSANIRLKESGEIPDFAQPYMVTEVNGVRVGIIGLTTTETRVDTKPAHVSDLEFMDYRDVIPTFAAKAREEGAELLMLIAHVCAAETRALAPVAAEYGVSIIGGGHCHEEVNETVDGVRLVESGFFMRGYIRIELLFDTQSDQVVQMEAELIRNNSSRLDEEISALMDDWRARTDPELWEPIGFVERSIDRQSPEMARLLLAPWLEAFPGADVAIAESRYVQQDLYPGELSQGSIVGILSTTNQIVEVELTGERLIEVLESRKPLASGVVEADGYRLDSGEPIDPQSIYRVLVPDTLYYGGFYYEFSRDDPEPTFTGIDWRQPALDWIRSLGSTRDQPIDAFVEVPN